MNASFRIGLVLCLSWLSVSALAQQSGSAAAETASSADASDRNLTLDVVVSNRSGKAVPGLQAQDFVVLDNKKPQKIVAFQASGGAKTEPVEFILVVDEVNTSFDNVSYVREEIKKFLLQNGGNLTHPVTLAFFSDNGTQILNDSSRDGNALLASFNQHETALRSIRRSTGFYGAEERFQLSVTMLNSLTAREAQTPGRKIVIWVSPGWPLLFGPNVQLTSKVEKSLFESIVAASTALRRARITLYSVDPLGVADSGRYFYYREFLKPVSEWKNAQPANLALQVLTTQTGGLVLNGSSDITAQVERCVADADTFYTLTVEPPPAEKPNEYHAIEVKVEPQGLTARTRQGYYGQP
jgi:VWFA-related protein